MDGSMQASLCFTISHSFLKFMSTESVMLSNHLILCHPLLLLPAIFPCISVFSNESALLYPYPFHTGYDSGPIWLLVHSSFAFIISVPWRYCHMALWHLWLPFWDLIKDFPWIHPTSSQFFQCHMFTSSVWDTLLSADPTGRELMRTDEDKQFSPLRPWQLCQSFLNKSTGCWFNELVLKEDSGLQYRIYSVSGDLNTH